MKMKNIKEIAKKMNIGFANMDKKELVRVIQKTEGNFPCFATGGHECDQMNCLWREDCLKFV